MLEFFKNLTKKLSNKFKKIDNTTIFKIRLFIFK